MQLLADPELIGAKVQEEAGEVARAVAGESDERIAEEAADTSSTTSRSRSSRATYRSRAFDVLLTRRR